MGWAETLLLLLGVLITGFAAGFPIFIAFFTVCIGTIVILFGDKGFGIIANSIFSASSTVSLTTIGMFVLMGDLLFRSGATNILFKAINRVFGRLKGRLYFLVITLSTIFGALSGSVVAVTAMLGRSILPSMKKLGYDEGISIATILSGASLAPIIPPSIAVIVLGSLVNVSIGGLLVAGLLPGLLIAALTGIYILIRIKRNPSLAPNDDPDDTDNDESLKLILLKCLPFVLVIFSVIGFILLGIATPSEAAASGVMGALITTAIYRKLTLGFLIESLKEAVLLTGSIMAIFAASSLFAQILSFTGASSGFLNFFLDQDLNALTAFLLIMLITLVACMFIDLIAYMLVSVPIYAPIVEAFGFDPIWFWSIYLINITLGSVTPPFGYALFTLKAALPELSMSTAYKSAWSVVAIFTIAITILYLVPEIVTFIPSLVK